MRALRGFGHVAVLAVALGFAGRAEAELILSDPTSDVYSTLAVAGQDEVSVEKDARVTGNVHSNGRVSTQALSIVQGNISAVRDIDARGTVSGTVMPGAPRRPLPALFTAAEARGLADRVFEQSTSFVDERIDDVVFVAGNVRLGGTLDGTGTILATGNIEIERVAPGDGTILLSPSARLSLIAFQSIKLHENRSFRGFALAGLQVMIEKDASFEGVAVAWQKVQIRSGARVTFLAPTPPDSSAPFLWILSPTGRLVGEAPPQVFLRYEDQGSGIDPARVEASVDGLSAALSCQAESESAVCSLPPLATGGYRLRARVRDRAGNETSAVRDFYFVLDRLAPIVQVAEPQDGAWVDRRTVRIAGTVADDSQVVSLTINGQTAGVKAAGAFSALVPVPEGASALRVVATDEAGRQGSRTINIAVDSRPPGLTVETPVQGQRVNDPRARVSGRVEDENGLSRFEVAGVPTGIAGGQFDTEVELQEGLNHVVVRAVDPAGNLTEQAIDVERFTLPRVEIESPADLGTLASPTVRVEGRVSDPAAAVTVNGVAAVVSGDRFAAADVPLVEGGNILTATIRTGLGRVGSDSINVVRDLTAPRLYIDHPRDGSTLYEPTVRVSGLVNDIVAGSVNASEVTVTVGGRPATVVNRSFLAEGIPLAPGDNVIDVEAIDESGNVGRAQVTILRETAAVPRVVAVSGDGQTGSIGSELAEPLTVAVVDAAGLPVPGIPVLFKVVGTDGSLGGGRRQVSATTGPDGRASVRFTLGTRAGVGNQRVEAVVSRFRGPAVFRSTALPGAPNLIVVDSGDQQVGSAGQALPRPLVAAVTDAGFNRLEGVRAVFRVVRGSGQFQNRQREISIMTDSDGRAVVPFLLPPDGEGTAQVVEAVIEGLEGGPVAAFTSYAWGAGDASQTSIHGIVLDNTNQPVPGVTLRILDTESTARTDEKGLFRIQPAPVGTVRLVVDGSTAAPAGSWPDLEFVLTTVAGRDNDLGMPIYLLPLDLANGVVVDETRGGTLTLPEVPGFALQIQPGSVTFPGGSKSGVVSVTVVHSDKVPMVPNFGQQPRLIVTIQPAGARFDPPAPLTLPNLEGLPPGRVTELYSFDHDLGHFVSIGPATVSEDGTVIRSNPGVGILKAGWHCGGTPGFTGSTHDCPICHSCILNRCTPDDAQPCDDKDECTINDKCKSGGCKGDPVEVRKVDGACVGAVGQPFGLTADSNAPDRVMWQAPGSVTPSGTGGSFLVAYNTEGDFTVTALCKASSQTRQVSTGPDCANITPVLLEPEVPGSTRNWGQVVPGVRRLAKYKGCVSSPDWCFRLEEYTEEHSFVTNGTGAIDISGANDSDVTAATCQQIIADLTPPSPGTPQGPPRSVYWSSGITTAHERFHVTDLHNRITQRVFTDLQTFVSNRSNCTHCKSPVPAAVFDAEKERLFNLYATAMQTNAEQLAHDHSNAMYRSLIAQIRQRAQTENWPVVCR